MHNHNLHSEGYDFEVLIANSPELADFVFRNTYGKDSIDFADPKAVKALNTALLKLYYGIDYWEFPEAHLCPPIPGRVEYIHLLYDLLKSSRLEKGSRILDIGTGATCIYPLLGQAEYHWHFIASDIDEEALKNAQQIINKNGLESIIELRHQRQTQQILTGILDGTERITAAMCNPPFYKNEAEALQNTQRKLKGLGKATQNPVRNFSGTAKELWYPGGEKAFLHNYLYQSSLFKTNCYWYTSLVSKKEHIKSMRSSLNKLGATQFKVLELSLGNKISRVVAWSFLTAKQQKNWTTN
ncbi:23S rRNA (adenine(1618)-N(6))-methyltransferase RlmF [Psychroserpens algicola]|uniref:Ribosomal RNA large subunit methyltransferase F n=1 Tax=Psychroserpens algicola TaxID=1719034 RepID=A0ABT0H5P9_9FLAO|nr:23S rRNA (adenine(1618)-N(6))-methyltransferase RlmF [Psychroserpens algicola]MCK8479685.1 23S rRNA (adenine(1618)-N(6))-methyltransferase RlmF [Psychroserpens algicola]